MIGRLVGGHYKIIETLGGGSFGKTYIAEDTQKFNAKCVVKQLKPIASTPGTLEVAKRLFEKEAQTLHSLGSHEQIPQLLAYFQDNQEFYLVQEFIDGHDLRREILPGKRLTESYTIALLQSILEPLAFIHQQKQKIIHRDIKPANLIRRKKDDKIVLIDFGAVKELAVTQVVNSQGQTRIGTIIGTPGYMPSEQCRGRARLSSDIYAVGMIGIQALTGKIPLELQEDEDTGEIIWHKQLQISPSLKKVLDKMVSYDFRQRYRSAVEARQALQQLVSSYALQSSVFSTPSVKLISGVGVDYTRLRDLLIREKWKEADEETARVMVQAAQPKGSLALETLEKFPCEDLQTIDRLWGLPRNK